MSENRNLRTLGVLCGVAAVMVGMSFAAVPLYNWFCRVTGFAGTTQQADAGSDVILDKTIKVRFDGTVSRDLPWEFEPEQREIELPIGETGLAFYRAKNLSDRPITGTAAYNVAPFSTGGYFTKIQCFCFTEQRLEPGQEVQMPVYFYVDPEIMEDDEARRQPVITLSYTFYETEESKELAAAAAEPAAAAN